LPVFYRETLGRLLCLERFRNLIETNISAGIIALYTDHKPGLFENSLSNKGQLSAWRIAETADLQSIVQTHYRQGSKMLLPDPQSRVTLRKTQNSTLKSHIYFSLPYYLTFKMLNLAWLSTIQPHSCRNILLLMVLIGGRLPSSGF
jgi:hypothetical protein